MIRLALYYQRDQHVKKLRALHFYKRISRGSASFAFIEIFKKMPFGTSERFLELITVRLVR